MSFITEVELSRDALVSAIVGFKIPEAIEQRVLKPKQSKYSGSKHVLPKQSPSPLDARANDFYVFKRISRMLESEFPKKLGCDPIDALEGFRVAPKAAIPPHNHAITMLSPNSSKANKMLQDARAWDFQFSEALEQSKFLKTREMKANKSGKKTNNPVDLPEAITRSEIMTNIRLLSEISLQSSENSDDNEFSLTPTRILECSPRNGNSSPSVYLKSSKRSSILRRHTLSSENSLLGFSTSGMDYLEESNMLFSNIEEKRSIMSVHSMDSRTIMQTDASDPDSDETEKELADMKKILETAKCRPFLDSRRCSHDEINPYGNSDFLNEYQDEHRRALSRLQERKSNETAPKAKHMHVKKEKFKSTENAFFDSLKTEIINAESTSKFEVKSHLYRPRQLEGIPGYEYQRYCELHSIPIQKQIALKLDATKMIFVNTTMAGSPQATAFAHFLQNTTDLQEIVIDSCSVRGLEFKLISTALANLRTLSSLTLIGADLLNDQSDISSSFAQLNCLTELIVKNCKLNDLQGSKVMKAIKANTKLTKISLAQNLVGLRTCNAIAEIFCDPWIKWQDMDLSWNHVQGVSPIIMFGCLEKNYTVQSIDLSWNGLRHETSLFMFCNALSTSDCVKFVNLSNCQISDYGALLIADLLNKTKSLTELNLLENPIRTFGCKSILKTLGLRQRDNSEFMSIKVMLPLEAKSVMESVLDIETLSGKVNLDLSLPSHRHVLNAVFKRKEEGLASVNGAMLYKGMPCSFEKVVLEAKKLEQDFLKRIYDDVERIWNGAQEPEPEPEIVKANNTAVSSLFIPELDAGDEDEETSVDNDSADQPTDDGNDDELFTADFAGVSNSFNAGLSDNLLTFMLIANRSSVSATNLVTPFELDYFVRLLRSIDLTVPGNSVRQFNSLKLLFSGSSILKTTDIIEIISQVCDEYKMHATKLSLTRCIEPNGMERILESLSKSEYVGLSKIVSGSIMKFTPNNPTGKYSLRLSEQLDRDFFIRLIDIKTAQDEVLKNDTVWQSYRYNNMERNFLNTLMDGKPFAIDRSSAVPMNGNISFDFVSHIPPHPDDFPAVTEKHILEFVIGPQDEAEKLNIFRRWSNVNVFTVQQAIRLLSIFSGDENRVEFCVTSFNRLLDWHGRLRLLHVLSTSAMKLLTSRIGYQNLWDDVTAIQYHEYDLSIASERFCVGRLVDLAVIEPGENMCYEHFNEREFQCPASWANDDVPKKGFFSVYYCRSDKVIAGLISRCPPHSIPVNFLQLQPSGQDWVELHKRNRLRRMIKEKFPDTERAFLVMDESGDGSLSRKEFARGLRILGIELKAHELANLMELLDDDGGGEIDSEEFVAFVNGTD